MAERHHRECHRHHRSDGVVDHHLRHHRGLHQLAADIIETSITTNCDAVGRIAAVAVIRTFLNYFLERDLTDVRERPRAAAT